MNFRCAGPLLNSVRIASETMVRWKCKREHEKENKRECINKAKNSIKSEKKLSTEKQINAKAMRRMWTEISLISLILEMSMKCFLSSIRQGECNPAKWGKQFKVFDLGLVWMRQQQSNCDQTELMSLPSEHGEAWLLGRVGLSWDRLRRRCFWGSLLG